MTIYYDRIRALIDPEQSEPRVGRGPLQEISLILLDEPGMPQPLRPAAVTLLPGDARELAFELLQLAEPADRKRTRR